MKTNNNEHENKQKNAFDRLLNNLTKANKKQDKEMNQLFKASIPLLKLLNKNYNPHDTIVISQTSVKIFSEKMGIPKIYDFIKD